MQHIKIETHTINTIEWYDNVQHIYICSNIDNKIIDRKIITKITRIRIGHTNITHRELIKLDIIDKCNCTNVTFMVKHMLLKYRAQHSNNKKHIKEQKH